MPLCFFTVIYWAVTGILAQEKPLWYDELCTFYISRLPAVADIWKTLLAGAEQHPPSFFMGTRAFGAPLGYSPFSIRLPEILGFWIMSVALFLFVRKRAPVTCGLIAMSLPLVTGAYYYAYEARPYGLVLGFSALSLLCWQAAAEGHRRRLAIAGLFLSLAAAVSCHYYAVLCFIPIGLGELVRTMRKRRLDIWIWVALIAGLLPLLLFLPLIKACLGYSSKFWAKPTWVTPVGFFERLLGPAVLSLCGIPLILALEQLNSSVDRDEPSCDIPGVRPDEIAAAAGFVLLPVVALFLAKFVTGAFTDRYAISAVIGVSVLVAFSVSVISRKSPTAGLLVTLLLIVSFLLTAVKIHGQLSGEALAQIRTYQFLQLENSDALPLVIDGPHLFFALSHTAAQRGDKKALIYLADIPLATGYTNTDDVERGLAQLKRVAPLDVRDFHQFCESHKKFLIYASSGPFNWITRELEKEQWSLSVRGQNEGHFLFLANSRNGR